MYYRRESQGLVYVPRCSTFRNEQHDKEVLALNWPLNCCSVETDATEQWPPQDPVKFHFYWSQNTNIADERLSWSHVQISTNEVHVFTDVILRQI